MFNCADICFLGHVNERCGPENISTHLKRRDTRANAAVKRFNLDNSLIFGKEELEKSARSFLLNEGGDLVQ
jgi:hypothetical protein